MSNDFGVKQSASADRKVVGRSIGQDGGGLERIAQGVDSAPWPRTPVAATLAHSQLTVSSTAVDLGDHQPSGATHAELVVTGNLRCWDDGKTPTTTEGKPLYGLADSPTYYWVEAPADFKMIAESTDVEVTISWYKYTLAL